MGVFLSDPISHFGLGRGLCCWRASGCPHVHPKVRRFWNAVRLLLVLAFILWSASSGETIDPCVLILLVALTAVQEARHSALLSGAPILGALRLRISRHESVRPNPRI